MAYGRPLFYTPDVQKKKLERELDSMIDKWRSFENSGKKSNFSLPSKFFSPEMKEFNDFFLSLTKVNPDDRPTITQCLEHKYISNFVRVKYEVEEIYNPVARTQPWLERLFAYSRDMDMDENLRLAACKRLVNKMNHKSVEEDPKIGENDITTAEILVCQYLKWHLL
jgi:serine/threonine protein kinase